MKNIDLKLLAFSVIVTLFVAISLEAGNRKGSKRVGGTNSKGKKSHYVGGQKKK
ncbi:hypothetical protein [Leptospira wolffii]|uniref:hypothetical protein n=1 Tax=Leptospira wolffii TaxID=409998 RepID=UPI0014383E5B|nr:hypothetical protein [Leptospira wolffii]